MGTATDANAVKVAKYVQEDVSAIGKSSMGEKSQITALGSQILYWLFTNSFVFRSLRYKHGLPEAIFLRFWHGRCIARETWKGQGYCESIGEKCSTADYLQNQVCSEARDLFTYRSLEFIIVIKCFSNWVTFLVPNSLGRLQDSAEHWGLSKISERFRKYRR